MLLSLLIIGLGVCVWQWKRERQNHVAVEPERLYLVTDKLLIPGALLDSHERSALGYRKVQWVEPKFVFVLSGMTTGEEIACEVPESLFLHVPRNTRFSKSEVEEWITLVSPSQSRAEPALLQGLSRFSTSARALLEQDISGR